MDWITIIFLAIGLPLIGSLIGAYMVGKKYTYMKENPFEFGLDEKEFRRRNFGKYIIIPSLFQTGPTYGLMVVVIFYLHLADLNVADETLSKFGMAMALAVGAPGLFSNISRGFISREGIESIAEDPKTLGKAIVNAVIVETPMIYGLLIAVLLMGLSGLFLGKFEFNDHQVDVILNSVIVFACLSLGVLLSGILFIRVEEPFSLKKFAKGIQVNVIGTIPSIIGLIYVFIRFNEIGIFTGG
jgi:F0F1-type ATP synthase membrane subunit c/vacuolar-type H+-ATPase subunit K